MKYYKYDNDFAMIKNFPFVKNRLGGVFMYKYKTQARRIAEAYITVVVLVTAVSLVITGIAVSKINTDYMRTGERAGKIVAERESTQISVTTHERLTLTTQHDFFRIADKILTFLPPPVNTTYLTVKEIAEMVRQNK